MKRLKRPCHRVYYSQEELLFLHRCAHDFAGPVSMLSVAKKIYREKVFRGRRSVRGLYLKLYEMAVREGYVDPLYTAHSRRIYKVNEKLA